ncbi:MAG: TetR/AcrR family transcriptional regulator [Ectothiorhodospiraceae bacterium]|nr:TetR/AcrR family transcriptional regulator [Ectothiorhodospiraceae bacterium]MCH8502815.1 TetR/AcrR family transcriptional regulator [Ectothiorhodospiraceae bacterium]
MRKSREEAAETRERIVKVAAKLFRERGVEAVGVAELMREAGLTHGGFYKHFPSKEALVAEACRSALIKANDGLRHADTPRTHDLEEVLSRYLSTAHRDHPGSGCAIAALGSEISRQEGEPRRAIGEGAERMIRMIERLLRDEGLEPDGADARGIVACMLGGLLLSRALDDPEQSRAALDDTRTFVLKALGKD